GPTGAPSAAPTAAGVAVGSGALSSVALEAMIAGNRVLMAGGGGISQKAFGAAISGNSVTGGEIGIETLESDGNHGNVIAGNTVNGTAASGIKVENELNEIIGNEVSLAGAAGILVDGSTASAGVEGNLV